MRPQVGHQLTDQRLGVAFVRGDQMIGSVKDRHHAFFDDRLKQGELAVEIEVERSFGDASSCGHIVQAGGRKAFLDKKLERGGL